MFERRSSTWPKNAKERIKCITTILCNVCKLYGDYVIQKHKLHNNPNDNVGTCINGTYTLNK